MTTETRQGRAEAILAEGCLHNYTGACWLCSDERPMWREMRLAAGLGSRPPLARPEPALVVRDWDWS